MPMETYYQSSLEKCIREGLIKENGDRYCLTDFGIDVSKPCICRVYITRRGYYGTKSKRVCKTDSQNYRL